MTVIEESQEGQSEYAYLLYKRQCWQQHQNRQLECEYLPYLCLVYTSASNCVDRLNTEGGRDSASAWRPICRPFSKISSSTNYAWQARLCSHEHEEDDPPEVLQGSHNIVHEVMITGASFESKCKQQYSPLFVARSGEEGTSITLC